MLILDYALASVFHFVAILPLSILSGIQISYHILTMKKQAFLRFKTDFCLATKNILNWYRWVPIHWYPWYLQWTPKLPEMASLLLIFFVAAPNICNLLADLASKTDWRKRSPADSCSPQQRCVQTRWWESVPQIFRFVKRTYLLYVLDSPPVSSSGWPETKFKGRSCRNINGWWLLQKDTAM